MQTVHVHAMAISDAFLSVNQAVRRFETGYLHHVKRLVLHVSRRYVFATPPARQQNK